MNDQQSGQLTSTWTIPPYARGLLWLESEVGVARCEGANGLFSLNAPAESGSPLLLRWGGAEGSALAQLVWKPDSLEWAGEVQVGGYVDAIYAADALEEIAEPLRILYISGAPLRAGVQPYPTAATRKQLQIVPPRFYEDRLELTETTTTWVAYEESSALALAQDALVTKLPVFAFGHLAEEDWGWHRHLALPVGLDGMTLFPE